MRKELDFSGWSGEYSDIDLEEEREEAESFEWVTPKFTIIADSLELDATDDYNINAILEMSNGDTIEFKMVETKRGRDYDFGLYVNEEIITDDFDDIAKYEGPLVGGILGCYLNNYLSKKYK